MAKKAKAKKKLGKTISKGKSQAKKKKKVVAATPYIAVVSSVALDQDWKDKFKAGVGATKIVYRDGGFGYKKKKLMREIRRLNGDNDCLLIVTAGGLIAYEAANLVLNDSGDHKFISLVGGAPPAADQSSQFWGGVSLESHASNDLRINYLINVKAFSKSNICLLHNLNSEMRSREIGQWNGGQNPVHAGNDLSGENDSSAFTNDFSKIPAGATAVVISADPFFLNAREDLIQAANASGKFICYPLQDYLNSTGTKPTAGNATLYGPDLSAAYKLLGQQAILAIPAATPLPLQPATNVVKDVT